MLVGTDVIGRGLDVSAVDTVIQVFPPAKELINYIHRSGRTGRANAPGNHFCTEESKVLTRLTGLSILLYTQDQSHIVHKLESKYGIPFKVRLNCVPNTLRLSVLQHQSPPTAEQLFQSAMGTAEKVKYKRQYVPNAHQQLIEEKASHSLPPEISRLAQILYQRYGSRALDAALIALVDRIPPQQSTYALMSKMQRKKQNEELRYNRKVEHRAQQQEKEAKREQKAARLFKRLKSLV